MSLKTPSRYARSRSPSETPGRRASVLSPPASISGYSSTLNGFNGPKLNIVSRVAIEGKARKDKDTVGIKMYLKISVPVDSVEPGTTIPLFPEDNIKVVTSQIHPLDGTSVPYHFASQSAPLLHNAARALNLSARSSRTYAEAFDLSPGVAASSVLSSRSSSKSVASNNDPSGLVEEKYTGHILVSGYQVSYVVPKYFPAHFAELPTRINFGSTRRMSVGDKNYVHFMAAIDMLVPYVSRPPRAPFLLSIPTPRCLQNNIRLRIFPPRDGSSSSASLSDDDAGSWDLTSDPHVSRATSRMSRVHSTQNFADDESSDSSTTGFSEGCGLQGTFPSAERIRVRWAKPKRPINVDGRGRVGVREVKGEMSCIVRGKMKDPDPQRNGAEGVVMDVEYKATCKGVWYDGVATQLGMEIGLLARSSDVSWVTGSTTGWDVTGGNGYTGFDSGVQSQTRSSGERHDSLDSSSPLSTAFPSRDISRTSSTSSSTSSLLRAPLPTHNVGDYSFEGSSSISTLPSVGTSTTNLSQSEAIPASRPGQPITIHINMNELLPPTSNIFTFSISGTILIVPKTRTQVNGSVSLSSAPSEDDVSDPKPIVLPEFTVFVADSSTIASTVRNEVEVGSASIEVCNGLGDHRRDPQIRKTVLQKGAQTKCGADGGRIVYHTIPAPSTNGRVPMPERTRTSSNTGVAGTASTAALMKALSNIKMPTRSGPPLIPYVNAVVTPLTPRDKLLPNAYAVRLTMPTTDTEWLEFGLGYPERDDRQPKVDIASVSVDGVPVRYETAAAAKPDNDNGRGQIRFEQMSGKEWISWVKVQSGSLGSGTVVVDYIVEEEKDSKGKKKAENSVHFVVFLPTFSLPLGKLDVVVEDNPRLHVKTSKTNLSFTGTGGHLLEFSIPEFFYPHLHLSISRKHSNNSSFTYYAFTTILILLISMMVMIYTRLPPAQSGGLSLPNKHSNLFLDQDASHNEHAKSRYDLWSWWTADRSENLACTLPDDPPITEIPSETSTVPFYETSQSKEETKTLPEWSTTSSSMELYHSPRSETLHRLMNISWDDLQPVATASYEKLTSTAMSFWQLFRRVYHYPLPPP